MIDREKVIKAVECRRNVHKRCGNPCEQIGNCKYAALVRDFDGEPYYPYYCDIEKLCDDILLLLKEQEAVKPKIDAFEHPYCPKCKVLVYQTWNFCPHCGKGLI